MDIFSFNPVIRRDSGKKVPIGGGTIKNSSHELPTVSIEEAITVWAT